MRVWRKKIAERSRQRFSLIPTLECLFPKPTPQGYPYPRPPNSFVWHAGTVHTISDSSWRGVAAAGDLPVSCPRARAALAHLASVGAAPVLGIGSNAAPCQLARKFPPSDPAHADAAIVLVRALVQDHDVVYAPLLSSYGSATATLAHAPGTSVEVYVTFLTPTLLARMHETEAAYDLVRLPAGVVRVGASVEDPHPHTGVPQLGLAPDDDSDAPLAYVHQRGAVLLPWPGQGERVGGAEADTHTHIALAEVRALARTLPALPQPAVQAHIAMVLDGAPPADVAAWAVANVADDDARRARVEALGTRAAPLATPGAAHVARLGCVFGRSVD